MRILIVEVEEKILEEKGRIEGTPQGYLRTMLLGSGEEEARSLRLLLETGALSGVRKSWLFLIWRGAGRTLRSFRRSIPSTGSTPPLLRIPRSISV